MKKTLLAIQSLLPAEMQQLEEHFEVIRLWKQSDPEAVLHKHERDIVAILSTYNSAGVSSKLIAALPNLEIIAQFGVGVNNIDLKAAYGRDIAVTYTPDILTNDTADIALSLVLCLARRIVEGDMFVRVGRWQQGPLPLGTTLTGKTAGIVGLGRIGKAIARRLEAFELNVVYHGRGRKEDQPYEYFENLEDMVQACDFLVLSCSGGPETQDLVDYKILEVLGPEGFLVNIARGSVVNEEDLLVALANKAIAGAGLDVFAHEPDVPEALIKMDNVVLLPHIGSATQETRHKMGQLAVDNLLAYFEGRELLTPVKEEE